MGHVDVLKAIWHLLKIHLCCYHERDKGRKNI